MKGVYVQNAFVADSIHCTMMDNGDVHLIFDDDGEYLIPAHVFRFLAQHIFGKWARLNVLTQADAQLISSGVVSIMKGTELI